MAGSFDDPGLLAIFGSYPRCLCIDYIRNIKLAILF
jgi:hypothetical protein